MDCTELLGKNVLDQGTGSLGLCGLLQTPSPSPLCMFKTLI